MDITVISDLHGNYPKLEGGDLLIVAGDLTRTNSEVEYMDFLYWLCKQQYRKIVFIAGNHDTLLQREDWDDFYKKMAKPKESISYLCDSGSEFYHHWSDERNIAAGKCYRIWGSPWTKTFPGMNPHCKAFTVDTEEELAEKWALIPNDIDILITHSPPRGIHDLNDKQKRCGSTSLFKHVNRVMPKLHVFGHVHEAYANKEIRITARLSPKDKLNDFTARFVNASHVNEKYQPVNKPIRIEL